MPIRYPLLTRRTVLIALSLLTRKKRGFHTDAAALAARLDPPLDILGQEHIPASGPCLITVNHYIHPGFKSWWVALAVSAAVPADIHWVMTAAWVFPGNRLRQSTIAPVTRWIFGRIAGIYGFTRMPPMPPDPREVVGRASSVREVLTFAKDTPNAVIGLAPEGGDSRTGILNTPPPGAGRFMLHLARLGYPVAPVGLYESGERLCLHFGPRYQLSAPAGLSPEERDSQTSHTAMQAIARLVPEDLQGDYGRIRRALQEEAGMVKPERE